MTICATVYKPREGGLDDILTYGKVRVAYHPSTQPGLQMFAQALLAAGYDGSETLVITGAGKEISFPCLEQVANGATLPSPVVAISQVVYDALVILQDNPNHWANLSGRLKGSLSENGLVDNEHRTTARAEASMRAFEQRPAHETQPKLEIKPVESPPKPKLTKAEVVQEVTTDDDNANKVISQATYDALVGLKKTAKHWDHIAFKTKGILKKNGYVDDLHKPTALANKAMQAFLDAPPVDEKARFEPYLSLLPMKLSDWQNTVHHRTRGKIEREGWAIESRGMMVRASN